MMTTGEISWPSSMVISKVQALNFLSKSLNNTSRMVELTVTIIQGTLVVYDYGHEIITWNKVVNQWLKR